MSGIKHKLGQPQPVGGRMPGSFSRRVCASAGGHAHLASRSNRRDHDGLHRGLRRQDTASVEEARQAARAMTVAVYFAAVLHRKGHAHQRDMACDLGRVAGFEPAASSSRTGRRRIKPLLDGVAARQRRWRRPRSRCLTVPDRSWRRIAAPIPLPSAGHRTLSQHPGSAAAGPAPRACDISGPTRGAVRLRQTGASLLGRFPRRQ
jgi:hypothetical protein